MTRAGREPSHLGLGIKDKLPPHDIKGSPFRVLRFAFRRTAFLPFGADHACHEAPLHQLLELIVQGFSLIQVFFSLVLLLSLVLLALRHHLLHNLPYTTSHLSLLASVFTLHCH